MTTIQYFNQSVIELSEEVSKHPPLRELILAHPEDNTFESKLGRIAAYCGLEIDGYFDDDAVNLLCAKLISKLRERRTSIIH